MTKQERRKEAVALKYDLDTTTAPVVVAKGKGQVADNILQKAKDHDVPIQEDPTLVQLLGELDINDSIPENLYNAVAEVFAFVYNVDKERKNRLN
ncbi:EscU/YscU/HrcU family type III secretion system export apparatus switch protein [Savagea sp. SN6]|uniref:EscU/YscU/HrcU family type III secretion system export apparatus switch protein n=1 Tax=Savagea serpentis TaxID=2785297 RepID=A0A8J7GHS0_9BACL|nr:EscU/YscU/HrcU family type III secretion system export apparatus switch protein [Savagea serpentis]MBF4499925.1 EscU/YscU/HrcU family type III secretion system export apparatus switch protein [Savagea serpentis]